MGEFHVYAFLCILIASIASGVGIWAWFTVKNRELDIQEKRIANEPALIGGFMNQAIQAISKPEGKSSKGAKK